MDINNFMNEMLRAQDGKCSICTEPTEMVDMLNISWCALHSFRGEFVNAMAKRGYPGIRFDGCYAIAAGVSFTVIAATQGSEEMVWQALAAIELGDECIVRDDAA